MKQIAKEIIQLILILVILVLGMASCSNKVVAIIDGEKIRERDIQKRIEYYQKVDHTKEVKVQPWMLSKGN